MHCAGHRHPGGRPVQDPNCTGCPSLAIIAGVIGAVLVFRPTESARIVTMLLGMSLLAEGILNLCVALCAVKIIRHQQPDVIEIDIE